MLPQHRDHAERPSVHDDRPRELGPDVRSPSQHEIELEAENGKTHLVLVHESFPTPQHRDLAGSGWPGFVDRIERLVTRSS